MRYEISIQISDKEYIDSLIVSLVRQGYNVYFNEEENVVCFTTAEDGVYRIQEG